MLVTAKNPNAFLSRVKARCYIPYGQIWGLAFEFSDGTKVNLGNKDDPNTDPYAEEQSAFKNMTVDLPTGCTSIDYYLMKDKCKTKVIALIFKKNNTTVAKIDLRDVPWEGHGRGSIIAPEGHLISSFVVKRDCMHHYSYEFVDSKLPNWLSVDWLTIDLFYIILLMVICGFLYNHGKPDVRITD